MTIDDAIRRLNELPPKIGREGEAIMQSEVPVDTGKLPASIGWRMLSTSTISIGTDIPYAKYVEHGRGEVRPVRRKALHWDDVFAMRSRPTKPNDFVLNNTPFLENHSTTTNCKLKTFLTKYVLLYAHYRRTHQNHIIIWQLAPTVRSW